MFNRFIAYHNILLFAIFKVTYISSIMCKGMYNNLLQSLSKLINTIRGKLQ